MRLTISRQGRFTSRMMEEVEPGRTLWCKGPYGEFVVRAAGMGAPVVLVAGGTGITPFSAFMEEGLIHPDTVSAPVRLYYGARTADLLVYSGIAERCAASLPDFEAWLCAEEGELPAGVARGRLAIDHIAEALDQNLLTNFYLSGPKPMITAFSEYLREVRCVPSEQILVDAWG
jgi:ferredoxin-NADP reductase